MAQHIPIELMRGKVAERLKHGVEHDVRRCYGGLRASLKWEKLPADYLEPGDSEVFMADRSVPDSMVAGGRATLEVHMADDKTINKIYFVA